jgi:hypothetical protein
MGKVNTMKVITKAVYKMLPNGGLEFVSEEAFEYSGPVAKLDRALQSAATKDATTAGTTAAGYGSTAANEGSTLNPFYTSEMKATHGFNPNQVNELLTAAEAGGGGANGALMGQAQQEAARTRNASGFTKSLDEAARDKSKAAAGASEGVAAEDVMGAKKLNQEGASGMEGLYGTNVGAQLKAMGQQNEDIGTALQAGQTGWLQNMQGTLNSLANGAKGAASVAAM